MKNAHLFFAVKEGEDPFEKYEELLFEDKKFFTQKPLVSSVFLKRLEKMDVRQKAFNSLFALDLPGFTKVDFALKTEENDVMRNYLNFQEVRKLVFNRIYQAQSIAELSHLIESLLGYFKNYCEPWSNFEVKKTDLITLAKEPDPSVLFSSIKSFHLAGGKNVKDIQKLNFDNKSVLVHEAKRLSLLHQKMQDEWNSLKN